MGLIPCGNCSCCKYVYITPATEFEFTNGWGKTINWSYTRYFSCDSKNALYIVICNKCRQFYLGKTDDIKQRCRKHASDVRIPSNSNCRECAEHLRSCSALGEPFFTMFPFYYVDNPHLRHFMERRFIRYWKPQLNNQ